MCIGSLSEAMHRYEVYNLPVSRVADILLDFYEGQDLRFTRRRGSWWVKSTPEYEKRHGARCGCGCRTARRNVPWIVGTCRPRLNLRVTRNS
jgi:hypothetical protein